jgi:hypothetical protein
MKIPIGGFFELEPSGTAGQEYHRTATLLTSGRACLRAILRYIGPSLIYIPFYMCDSVLEPTRLTGTSLQYYAIDENMAPLRKFDLGEKEYVLYVNYFGLKTDVVNLLHSVLGDKLILDNTQAFFERQMGGIPAFNSARKFFGVADGGYLYLSKFVAGELSEIQNVDTDHLHNRLAGKHGLAFTQYKEAEMHVSADLLRASAFSTGILRGINYAEAARRRRANFEFLHSRLAAFNRLEFELRDDMVPFCYPFMSIRPLDRQVLIDKKIYFPVLWPEVIKRTDEGFEWERELAHNLFPLPIDQRYGAEEMRFIADETSKLVRANVKACG